MLSNDWKISRNKFPELIKGDNGWLIEDIFQATLNNYAIDSGWYGVDGDSSNGQFITYLIKDYNWELPLVRLESTNLEDTLYNVRLCEDIYNKIRK